MEHFRLLTIIKTKQLMLTTIPMRANPRMRMLYHSTPLGTFIAVNIVSKGQLSSKGLFSILNSSKKRMKKFDLGTNILQVDLLSFVFWKNLKTPKSHLISKGLFGILNSSKKRTKKFHSEIN